MWHVYTAIAVIVIIGTVAFFMMSSRIDSAEEWAKRAFERADEARNGTFEQSKVAMVEADYHASLAARIQALENKIPEPPQPPPYKQWTRDNLRMTHHMLQSSNRIDNIAAAEYLHRHLAAPEMVMEGRDRAEAFVILINQFIAANPSTDNP